MNYRWQCRTIYAPRTVSAARPLFEVYILMLLYHLDWTTVHVLPAVLNIVARLSSRVFVGLPLCEYILAYLRHASSLRPPQAVLKHIFASLFTSLLRGSKMQTLSR